MLTDAEQPYSYHRSLAVWRKVTPPPQRGRNAEQRQSAAYIRKLSYALSLTVDQKGAVWAELASPQPPSLKEYKQDHLVTNGDPSISPQNTKTPSHPIPHKSALR